MHICKSTFNNTPVLRDVPNSSMIQLPYIRYNIRQLLIHQSIAISASLGLLRTYLRHESCRRPSGQNGNTKFPKANVQPIGRHRNIISEPGKKKHESRCTPNRLLLLPVEYSTGLCSLLGSVFYNHFSRKPRSTRGTDPECLFDNAEYHGQRRPSCSS